MAGDQFDVNHRTKFLLAPTAALALTVLPAACGSDATSSSSTDATAVMGTTAMSGATATGGTEMAGGEATAGNIEVTGVWMRQPAEGQTNSAAYGTITNTGAADIRLVGVSVPFTATVQLHETTTDASGQMQMGEVPDGFVIPAGGSFSLAPGGGHIMLIGIDPTDITGTVMLTMKFDDGTEVDVGAPVRTLDGSAVGDGSTGTTMAPGVRSPELV